MLVREGVLVEMYQQVLCKFSALPIDEVNACMILIE